MGANSSSNNNHSLDRLPAYSVHPTVSFKAPEKGQSSNSVMGQNTLYRNRKSLNTNQQHHPLAAANKT
jgi:hypothetical protein